MDDRELHLLSLDYVNILFQGAYMEGDCLCKHKELRAVILYDVKST